MIYEKQIADLVVSKLYTVNSPFKLLGAGGQG